MRKTAICAFAVCTARLLAQSQQAQPVFRPSVVLVPIDVRATDANGRPVVDLTQSDFTVLEDGKPQEIAFFSRASSRTAPSAPQAGDSRAATIPADARTFLIVLGRGHLEAPAKGLTAIMDFVRTGLAPEDRVGVAAYDRISDLTTDHQAVERLLKVYADRHDYVETRVAAYFSTLAGIGWTGVMPEMLQRLIDHVFDAPRMPRLRRLPDLIAPDDDDFRGIRQEISDGFKTDPLFKNTEKGIRARQDVTELFRAVEFLRSQPGEKQMIFVTAFPPEDGPVGDHVARMMTRLAKLASDARVVVSTIQTGGNSVPDGSLFPTRSFSELMAIENVRSVAKTTGGTLSVYDYAANGVRKIEERTAFAYVLGYYPSSSPADRKFHSIEVRINRPGVNLFYRRGYFANPIPPGDTRAVVSKERVDAALGDQRLYTDVAFAMTARRADGRIDIDLKIDPATVEFVEKDGRHFAHFDIAVVAGNGNAALAGARRDLVDLEFEPAAFAKLNKAKLTYTTSIELSGNPKSLSVKAAVYDYSADRIGTAVQRIR